MLKSQVIEQLQAYPGDPEVKLLINDGLTYADIGAVAPAPDDTPEGTIVITSFDPRMSESAP